MPKRSRKREPEDFNQVALRVVNKATEVPEAAVPTKSEISRIMSIMGRKGGLKGGKRRLETMTDEQRREAAFRAARARWSKAKKKRKA